MGRNINEATVNKWCSEAIKAKRDLENLEDALENSGKEEIIDWEILARNKKEELNALEEAIIESKDPNYNFLCAALIKGEYLNKHAQVVFDANDLQSNFRMTRLNIIDIDYFKHSLVVINSNNLNEIILLRDLTLVNSNIDTNTKFSVLTACEEKIKDLRK